MKRDNKVKQQKKSSRLVYIKILIPVFIFVFFELFARALAITVLKDFIAVRDLRTKMEKVYIPPPEPSNENVLRLYFYGASTTVGFPVNKFSYVNQLSYQLHHALPGKNIDVKNLGWSGTTSTLNRYSVISTFWHRPDAMIVYVSHNEFVHPEIETIAEYKAIAKLRDNSALIRIMLAAGQKPSVNDTNSPNTESLFRKRVPYRLLKPYYKLKLAILKRNYKAMADIAKKNSIPLIFITATSNVGQWSPPERPVTLFTPDQKEFEDLNQVREMIKDNKLTEAKLIIDGKLLNNPNNPYFLYMRANVQEKQGDFSNARKNYERAKNLDYLQWRASSEINNFVRTLADGKTIWVLDANKIFTQNSPHGITGFNLFIDNVHPNIQGHFLLANSIIELLQKDKIVEKEWWNQIGDTASKDEIQKEIGANSEDLYQLALISAYYCIKNPFFNFDCTESYLNEAEKIKSNDWHTAATYSVLYYLENNLSKAGEFYKKAEDLHGSKISQDEAIEIPYLLQVRDKYKNN